MLYILSSYFDYLLYFFYIDNNIPGPNTYKSKALIGTPIFNSKYQSPSFYSLSQKLNLPNRNDQYPGPGSYISFSEFGILDPNYKKRMQTEPDKNKEAEGTKNEENQDYEEFHEEKKEESKPEEKKESKPEEINCSAMPTMASAVSMITGVSRFLESLPLALICLSVSTPSILGIL